MPDAPAWTDDLLDAPHAAADKRRRVRDMFAAIAPSYDLNNRLHSFGRDQAWRRAAVRLAGLGPDDGVLDVACGTGDLAFAFAEESRRVRSLAALGTGSASTPGPVVGVDFTYAMLPIACRKADAVDARRSTRGRPSAAGACAFVNGDAQQLPLPDQCCDVVSIAFGIRNVQDVDAALCEFHRVLRPGGRVIVLEFSEPTNPLLRAMNRFYCGRVMPRTATWISRDTSGAYKYLPKSVETFIGRQEMCDRLAKAGFAAVVQRPMTFGVCVAYRGEKIA